MSGKARVIGFLLATLASPVALAQASFTNGQVLWNANGCEGCHDFLGAAGLQAVRDQIAQRPTPVSGLNFQKSLDALNAALTGTDLGGEDSSVMQGLFPAGTFSAAQLADLAAYIANMPTPAPTLSHSPFPGPVFPPTVIGATASQTVTVTNAGSAPLVFAINGAAAIATGPYSADYSVTGAQCQGMTLQPGTGSCTVTVQFRPLAGPDVARTASLALVTTAPATPTLVTLFGSVPAPAATAPPATPPAGAQPPTNSANAPSSGGGALPWQLVGLLLMAFIPGVRRRAR